MKIIFTFALFFMSFSAIPQEIYTDHNFNLQLTYPTADTVDRYDKNKKFSKTVFVYGNRVDRKSVQLIFESSSSTIKEFLAGSRAERKKGGYEAEVSEQEYLLKSGGEAVEIIRDMKAQKNKIHYFVFSPTPNTLLSIYFVEDTDRFGKNSKSQHRAMEAYKTMLLSLTK